MTISKYKGIILLGTPRLGGVPSYVHTVIAFSNKGKSINTIVSNGKRFIAYELVIRLRQQKNESVLAELSKAVNNTEKKEGKLHSVFETSFDRKECRTMKFIEQKLNYMPACRQRQVLESMQRQ